jgi:hypothetical protein
MWNLEKNMQYIVKEMLYRLQAVSQFVIYTTYICSLFGNNILLNVIVFEIITFLQFKGNLVHTPLLFSLSEAVGPFISENVRQRRCGSRHIRHFVPLPYCGRRLRAWLHYRRLPSWKWRHQSARCHQ